MKPKNSFVEKTGKLVRIIIEKDEMNIVISKCCRFPQIISNSISDDKSAKPLVSAEVLMHNRISSSNQKADSGLVVTMRNIRVRFLLKI